jgi:hypothetical protein
MWVYSTTHATSAHAAVVSTTASGTTFDSTSYSDADFSQYHLGSLSTNGTTVRTPYETTFINQTRGSQTDVANAVTATATWSERQEIVHGYTRSTTGYTTEFNGGAATSSAQDTTTRSVPSHSSSTVTHTIAATIGTTTSQAITRSVVSTSTNSSTITTSQNTTQTTSTTQAQTITRTTYATTASTTIAAPVSLVPITELEFSELGYSVTTTGDTAGYAPGIAVFSFSKRTGTYNTDSTALAATSTTTFTRTVTQVIGTTGGITLTTSRTTTSADTFRSDNGVYPPSTTTRVANVLQTLTTSFAILTSQTLTSSFSGQASNYVGTAETIVTTHTTTAPLTFNVSPTQTSTAAIHITWSASSAVGREGFASSFATSASLTATASASGTFSASSSESTTTTVTSTSTESGAIVWYASNTFLDTCNIPAPEEHTDSFSDVIVDTTLYTYYTTVHNAPASHTIYESYYSQVPVTVTTTGTATSTTSASISSSSSSEGSFSSSGIQGISFTHPLLYPQVTFFGATSPWTVHAMHPRQGFRDPLALVSTDALFSNLSISPSSTFYYPQKATQDDSAGAATPILFTDATRYETGASIYTAQWVQSDSRLYITSGVTGASTRATFTVSFSGAGAASWYAPQSTARTSGIISDLDLNASLVGGVVQKSEYGIAAIFPPGVRNWTHHFGSAISTSWTTWLFVPHTIGDSSYALAMPTRTETVWSITQRQTSWSWDNVLSASLTTGATARPILTVSKYPNL